MPSTRSRSATPVVGLGSQEPRIRRVPEYHSTAGQEVIDVAALAGLHLDPWEQLALLDACGERPDGKWAAFEVGIKAPRQNGKGSILEARELAGLFVFGEQLLIHSAHEQLTATNHFNRLLNLIDGIPEFRRRMLKPIRGKGSEAIRLRTGQEILFKTRTGGGGRGLSGDFVALDEAMICPPETTGALVPTMAARSLHGNPQLWYAGSAVDQMNPKHDGIVFTRLKKRALAGVAGIAYLEWSADVQAWLAARRITFDPKRPEIDQVTIAMLADPKMWAQANPGLGIRISLEHIAREHSGALGAREFAVERLGIEDPPDDDDLETRVIAEDVWKELGDIESSIQPEAVKSFAVDVNPDRTWGSISVAGAREDGLQHIEVVEHKRGTGWILDRCIKLDEDHEGCRFALDARGPAAFLIQPFKDAGLTVIELSTQDYAQACGGFYDAADQARFRHIEQAELDEALASAKTAPLGDAWKWSRRQSTGADISPLVASTIALWASETAPSTRRVPLVAWGR